MIHKHGFCFFSQYGDCEGTMDRAHWIPKQRIRKALQYELGIDTERAVWDDRIWNWMCRKHHHRFDQRLDGRFRFEAENYPERVAEWAKEYGFEFQDVRTGWVPIKKEAAA